jgi:hypothetical protein
MNHFCATTIAVALMTFPLAQNAPESPSKDIIARVTETTVLVLSGEGAGRLSSTSTGVIVRPNGVVLVAYHTIRDAKEVQVRLKTGDIYDQVVLIGTDERRDVAALKITASNLPTLPIGSGQDVMAGETVYVVSTSAGLPWSATKGILAASRLADEIPGAGQGYRVLQFTAPVSAESSGGPLVDAAGALIGLITKGVPSGPGFAVPIDTIIGLADGTMNMPLGSGSALQMPSNRQTPASAAVAAANPQDILRSARTIQIRSKSIYFSTESLEKELARQKEFGDLGLVLVQDPRVADLRITIDRPLFTYGFTYSVRDTRTSIVLEAGRVRADDGGEAAEKIATELVSKWAKVRRTASDSKSN